MHDSSQLDLVGIGVAAVDELLELDRFPTVDAKQTMRSHAVQTGGTCINCLTAAARLGLRCHYAGLLGVDAPSKVVHRGMAARGVTWTDPPLDPDAGPSHAFILIDREKGTRTILMDRSRVRPLCPEHLDEQLIRRARAIYVDGLDLAASRRAAELARRHGAEVVCDFEENDPDEIRRLLPLIDHVILPAHFATLLSGEADPARAASILGDAARRRTIVTCGDEGAWYVERGANVRHQPAFDVDVVDTTGCGDAFRGAYVAAMLGGDTIDACVEFASAAAALSARRLGATAGHPEHQEVVALIERAVGAVGDRLS